MAIKLILHHPSIFFNHVPGVLDLMKDFPEEVDAHQLLLRGDIEAPGVCCCTPAVCTFKAHLDFATDPIESNQLGPVPLDLTLIFPFNPIQSMNDTGPTCYF